MGQPWGRLYCGTRHHRKIRILRQRCPDSWWIFYPLLEMAFEANDNGLIYIDQDIPYTLDEMGIELGVGDAEKLEQTLAQMADLRLISREQGFIRFLSYNDRQFKSDSSAERVRRYREKKKQLPPDNGNGNGALPKRCDDVSVTPPDTDTDTDTDINNPPPPSSGEEVVVVKKPEKKKTDYSQDFEVFWRAYPNKKGGKEGAWRKWEVKRKDKKLPPLEYLLKCLKTLLDQEDWTGPGNQFVPMLTTFLHNGRWTDIEKYKTEPKGSDPNCPECGGRGVVPAGEKTWKGCPTCRRNR